MSKDEKVPTRNSGLLIQREPAADVSTMRGRDVEFLLKGVEVHPTVKQVLYGLAEANYANINRISAMAAMIDQMSNIVTSFATIAGNMKDVLDRQRREVQQGGEDAPSSH